MKRIATFLLLPCFALAGSPPIGDLQAYSPSLAGLITTYKSQVPVLTQYAEQQDFRLPHEKLAIVAHELIHIASAGNSGYWNNGQILEGYRQENWAGIQNRQLVPTASEQSQLAPVWEAYWKQTPDNRLGNILDEINAYSLTVGFVCRYEPKVSEKQTDPLIGHLTLLNVYLRTYRQLMPTRYKQLQSSRVTRGIIESMASQGWRALAGCGVSRINNQEEIALFLNLKK